MTADTVSDDLATNELHHLAAFQSIAEGAIVGMSQTQEKARAIFDMVRRSYRYSDSTPGILEFTWADLLVEGNKRMGICDDLSVVLISHLRAVGIPTRLRLLVITFANQEREGHAVVEYLDDATWRHADVLYAFNNRTVYRKISGVKSVTVMSASLPDDTRSVVPWLDLVDPSGDGQLNPLGDFVLSSGFPGLPEPGYSH